MTLFSISMTMGLIPVAIDLWKPFDEDINVLFPLSLIYYPTIGFLAEVVFHVIPVLILAYLFGKWRHAEKLIIFLVALVEPLFHILDEMEEGVPGAREVWVGLEVFVFGLIQLTVFRKYSFLCTSCARAST